MSSSILASLVGTIDKRNIGEIAARLGESEQSVSRGVESSIAAVLGGLSNKAQDPGVMRQVLELASNLPANLSPPSLLTETGSPAISTGKRLLSSLFGAGESSLANALKSELGVRPETASTLMTLATPIVLSFLGKRAHTDGMGPADLGRLLQAEGATIRRALPARIADLIPSEPLVARAAAASAVVAQTVIPEVSAVAQTVVPEAASRVADIGVVRTQAPLPKPRVEEVVTPPRQPVQATQYEAPRSLASEALPEQKKSSWLWPLALALGAVLLGFFWFLNRDRPAATTVQAPAVSPPVERPVAAADLGAFVTRKLPGNVDLNIPEKGVEGRLLAFIQDPATTANRETWFDFDRLLFATGSATLQPESQEQLRNVAAILKAYPGVRLKVGGYTDNVGDAGQNRKLSQDRADAVVAQLAGMGIAGSRLSAEGYGDQHPVADNSTEEGRARNRRVSMRVMEK